MLMSNDVFLTAEVFTHLKLLTYGVNKRGKHPLNITKFDQTNPYKM